MSNTDTEVVKITGTNSSLSLLAVVARLPELHRLTLESEGYFDQLPLTPNFDQLPEGDNRCQVDPLGDVEHKQEDQVIREGQNHPGKMTLARHIKVEKGNRGEIHPREW